MENELSNCSEKLKIINEISEREKIIEDYNRTGFLDRDYAIAKITSLQLTDTELALATKLKQAASGSVPLHQADNALIIVNMQFQIDFLGSKLVKMELE